MTRVVRIGAIACVLIAVFCARGMAGTNVWTSNGPVGGAFHRIEASVTNGNLVYAAYTRSLYRSIDGGKTWQLAYDFPSSITDIAVDRTDGRTIYVATEMSGLLRSDNSGQSFVQIASSLIGIWGLGLNSTTLYYTSGLLYSSTDRGQNWLLRTQPPQGGSKILVDQSNANLVFVFTNGGAVFSRSINGGTSWQSLSVAPANSLSVRDAVMLSATSLVAATSDGVYITSDAGDTWRRTLTGDCPAITIDPNLPNAVIVSVGQASATGQMFRSTNSGATWQSYATTPLGSVFGMVVGRQSPATITVANGQGIQQSADEGVTWTESAPGPNASMSVEIVTTPAANSKVYALTSAFNGSSGLFSTTADSGWQRVNLAGAHALSNGQLLGQAKVAVKPGSPNSIYFLTSPLVVLRTNDGGQNWNKLGFGIGPYYGTTLTFDPNNPNALYATVATAVAAPDGDGLYRSSDGGISWLRHSVNLPNNLYSRRLTIDPANSDRMFLAAYQTKYFGAPGTGGLYRSTDHGMNWSKIGIGEDIADVAINPANSNNVYAATETGLQISSDGGASFNPNPGFTGITDQTAISIVIDPTIPTTLYVASYDPGNPLAQVQVPSKGSYVLRSVDAGQTWEVLRSETDLPVWNANKVTLDPNNPSLLYVGTGVRGVAALEIAPDLNVAISGHSGTRMVGATSSFDVRAENLGKYAATGVQLVTAIPSGVIGVFATVDRGSCSVTTNAINCVVGVLQPNQSVNLHVVYTIPSAMLLPLTATISAHERDSNTGNNAPQASAQAGEVVDLYATITPSASVVDVTNRLTYTVQVGNNGPSDSTSTTLTLSQSAGIAIDAAPTGCQLIANAVTCNVGALSVGATRTYTISATAKNSGTATASISLVPASSAADHNLTNNSPAVPVNVRPTVDLSVSITDSLDPATTASSFDYRVVVRNVGPDDAMGVVVAMSRVGGAAGTIAATQGTCTSAANSSQCSLGALASGASATITLTVSASALGMMSLQAEVASDGNDLVAGNNTAQESTTINAPPAPVVSEKGGGALDRAWLLLMLFVLLMTHAGRRHQNRHNQTQLKRNKDG